jgi:hypothetical protein
MLAVVVDELLERDFEHDVRLSRGRSDCCRRAVAPVPSSSARRNAMRRKHASQYGTMAESGKCAGDA